MQVKRSENLHMLLFLMLCWTMPVTGAVVKSDTTMLSAGRSVDFTGNSYGNNVLQTYCYPGKSYSLLNLFETVEFQLSIASDDYSEYGGHTPEEVIEHYNAKQSLFSLTLFSQKRRRVQLSPFEMQCIGVVSWQPYTVSLKHMRFDVWRAIQLGLGILIIFYAEHLTKNNIFYYLAGIVLGICASLLILIGLAAKLFPSRPMMIGVMVGGWTIGLYVLKNMIQNMRLILVTYREFVLWYLAVTGIVSFLVCYRIGPPQNPRSQNIIKWVLQAIGAFLVYFCSWHSSACTVLLVIIAARLYIPDSALTYVRKKFTRRFPSKRRLLTQIECYDQSVEETQRSLAQLREYVNSPNCHQWGVISSLNNPMRFATFATGSPHLIDEEIEEYSRTIEDDMAGADQEEAEDLLQYNMYYRPTGRPINYRQRQLDAPNQDGNWIEINDD